PAFSIWSVIYLGLAAYVVWQWMPANAVTERTRRTGWLIALSMLLNATWLLVTQQGWIWASVVVIALLMVVLGRILVGLAGRPARSTAERVVVDGTFGLYAGWVAVATCANVTAALVDSGVELPGAAGEWVGVLVLGVAVAVAALLAHRVGGRLAVAAAMAWGLAWIAIGRLTDQPASTVVGVAASAAALAVVTLTVVARIRRARPSLGSS
uniref:tryptophan-rich sensory protein n=1 Tax=Pseudactinotalea sp. TaxID=1926260 RepID=UPI003B3BDD83